MSGAQLTSPTVTHTNEDGTVVPDDFFPCETRYRELSYNGDVLVNVNTRKNDRFSTLYNIPIASHPVMANSDAFCLKKLSSAARLCVGEDEYDKGEYFIISGNARTLATQVRETYNTAHVFKKTKVDKTYLIS